MTINSLEDKTEEFWKKVRNAKTDHVLIFMILKELRDCDIHAESNQVKMTRLSKMKAFVELLDVEDVYKSMEYVMDSDEKLLEVMEEAD